MTSLYLYATLGLTDFFGENTKRNEISWSLTVIVIFAVFINAIKALLCDL
jgi:hypothetical protein